MKNIDELLEIFTGEYTLEDCACTYCLFYQGAGKECVQEVCCCAASVSLPVIEEKALAMEREAAARGK